MSRRPPLLLHRRALALALAWLLLLTQQVGLLHLLSHAHGPGGPAPQRGVADAAAPAAAADRLEAADGQPADDLCRLCLGLAGLGLALVPALLPWLRAGLAPVAPRWQALHHAAARPVAAFQARAPPVFQPC